MLKKIYFNNTDISKEISNEEDLENKHEINGLNMNNNNNNSDNNDNGSNIYKNKVTDAKNGNKITI